MGRRAGLHRDGQIGQAAIEATRDVIDQYVVPAAADPLADPADRVAHVADANIDQVDLIARLDRVSHQREFAVSSQGRFDAKGPPGAKQRHPVFDGSLAALETASGIAELGRERARDVVRVDNRDGHVNVMIDDCRFAGTVRTGEHPQARRHTIAWTKCSPSRSKLTNSRRPPGYSLMIAPAGVSASL
ncbi:MAG: hypothetical protein OSB00_01725 [Sphingomonas bacterium]|nr:hypothetical protein [Sphingomonas bacterium]